MSPQLSHSTCSDVTPLPLPVPAEGLMFKHQASPQLCASNGEAGPSSKQTTTPLGQ